MIYNRDALLWISQEQRLQRAMWSIDAQGYRLDREDWGVSRKDPRYDQHEAARADLNASRSRIFALSQTPRWKFKKPALPRIYVIRLDELASALAFIPATGVSLVALRRLRDCRRLRFRAASKLCLFCGYDLRGTPNHCCMCGFTVHPA